MMKEETKSEKQLLLAKGNFGTYHKPLAMKMGIEAALILNQLIDKYEYWVGERREFKCYGKHKAFYITYKDLSENGVLVSEDKLNRKGPRNPLEILEKAKLIKRNHERNNLKNVIYYVIFFDNISKTFERFSKGLNEKRDGEKKAKKLREMEQEKKRGKDIDDFLKKSVEESKLSYKNSEEMKLEYDSSDSVKLTSSIVPNIHITKNKITKNKKKKTQLTQGKENDEGCNDFSEDELDRMFNPEKYGEIYNYNNDKLEQHNFDGQLLYKSIVRTRRGKLSYEDFFNMVVNKLLTNEFKGFKMSPKDGLLIYDAIINNPLFELENEEMEERDEGIKNLKSEKENITQEEIEEEIDFDEDRYEHLYNHLWEKIMYNCYRIIDGKLKARFGNIFVGVREMSENYEPFIER